MKLHLISIFLLISSFNLNAQQYIPLVKDSVHWFVASMDQNTPSGQYDSIYEYYLLGDTTLNSENYKKVYRRSVQSVNNNFQAPYYALSDYYIFGVLREDTTLRRVYSILFRNISGSSMCFSGQEELLYDFFFTPGDSINDSMCIAVQPHPEPIISNGFQTILYGYPTIEYQRQGLVPATYYVGIGTWCGLFENEAQIDNYVLWDYCIGKESACGLTTNITEIAKKENTVIIYPNPTNSILTINLPVKDSIVSLELTSLSGEVQSFNYSGNNSMDIRNLTEGFYLLKILTISGEILTSKILKYED